MAGGLAGLADGGGGLAVSSVGKPSRHAAPSAPKPPAYTRTLLLAGALFGCDGVIGGQGFLSLAVLYLVVPALVVYALLGWKEPARLRRRFGSVGGTPRPPSPRLRWSGMTRPGHANGQSK